MRRGEPRHLGFADLDRILRETVKAMETSQREIFGIAEAARQEYLELRKELEAVQEAVARRIQQVDELERQDRLARRRLLEVSRDIKNHPEYEVREAYDTARDTQVQLSIARERETLLRNQRDSLERRLKRVRETVDRAENLISQVRMALELLRGNLDQIATQVEGMQRRQQLGVSIIRAQEEERRRVARDIHDGPAQLLANVVFRIEVCQRFLTTDIERAATELEQLKTLVRHSLQDVRKIIFDLRPMALDDLGLVPALRGYLNGFEEKTGLPVSLTVFGDERRMAPALEVAAFRLIQESLNNAWKHARAREVKVRVEMLPDRIRAAVQDDGVGFDLGEVLQQGNEKFGLISMRERVELLGGKINIRTRPGEGTRVLVEIPYETREKAQGEVESGGEDSGADRR